MLKKLLLSFTLISTLLLGVPSVNAAATILPTIGDFTDCTADNPDIQTYFMVGVNSGSNWLQTYVQEKGVEGASEFLACALKLGYVRFWMIPYFVIYALQFGIQLAGLIAVLMIVVGGYYYIAGGITDDKEKGKHIITYALGGFVLVLTSWFIVNTLLLALTS